MSLLFAATSLLLAAVAASAPQRVPIVLWHGVSTSTNTVQSIETALQFALGTSTPIFSVQVDAATSVDNACALLSGNSKLDDGFHLLAFDVGGLLARAAVQTCDMAVRAFVTLGSPHLGVLQKIANFSIFSAAQNASLAQLTAINAPDAGAKSRIAQLERVVLVQFADDDSHFVSLDSQWFDRPARPAVSDALGFAALAKRNALHLINAPGIYAAPKSATWFISDVAPLIGVNALPTPFPTAGPTPLPTPNTTTTSTTTTSTTTTTNTTTATTTSPTTTTTPSPTPAPIPAGCPQSPKAWFHLTPQGIAALATKCFANLTIEDTNELVADQCGAITPAQVAQINLGCDGLHSDCIGALSVSAVPNLATVCVAQLTGDAISGLTSVQVPALPLAFIGAIATGAVSSLKPNVITALSAAQFDAFGNEQLANLVGEQLAALSPAVCQQLQALQTTFFAPQSCSSLDDSCTLAIKSWSGFRGGCVATFALSLLRNASDAQLLSLSNAGWGGMTFDQYQYLIDERAKLVFGLSGSALGYAKPDVIGAVSQYVLANNLTNVNLTLINSTTYFATQSWLNVTLIEDDSAHVVTSEGIAQLPPASVAALRHDAVHAINDTSFVSFDQQQLAYMQPDAVSGITELDIVMISPDAFLGLCETLDYVSLDAALNTTAAQLSALSESPCRGPQVCLFLHNISDTQREAADANSTMFNSMAETCGLGGWDWVNTAIIVVGASIVALFFACCAIVEVKRRRRAYEAL
jgi:hypothetical protein